MAKGGDRKSVVILDDEPEYLQWVEDFLVSKGYAVHFCHRLSDGLRELVTRDHRLFIVDMNVPSPDDVDPDVMASSPLCQKYPGLAMAIEARNLGYGAHSIIAYSVHDDEAIDTELAKLHARYVLKGRPEVLKKVIAASLSPAPVKANINKKPAIRAKTPPPRAKR
jgi:CheY-like chemotaxis protein